VISISAAPPARSDHALEFVLILSGTFSLKKNLRSKEWGSPGSRLVGCVHRLFLFCGALEKNFNSRLQHGNVRSATSGGKCSLT
jgi:hypothetical protein